MGTTKNKLQRMIDTKTELKTVANNNGGEITDETPFSEYPPEFERVIGEKYEQGKTDGEQSESERFWNAYFPSRVEYGGTGVFSGVGWKDESFKPIFDMTFYHQGLSMFYSSRMTDIVSSLEKCGVNFKFIDLKNLNQMFAFAKTKSIPPMKLLNGTMSATFANCSNLVTIRKLTLSSDGSDTFYSNTFGECTALENIELEGVIGKNNFNVQWSTKLTRESLLNILNCLKDYSSDTSGTVWTVTIGDTNKAKLTADELAIAENKGWEVL